MSLSAVIITLDCVSVNSNESLSGYILLHETWKKTDASFARNFCMEISIPTGDSGI